MIKTDYKENALVVQSNSFIRQTANNLKANEIKMFDIFVSCIDTQKPKTKVTIRKSELLKAMGDTGTHYTTQAETLKSLFNKSWYYTTENEIVYRHYLNGFNWAINEDYLTVEFHKEVLPMLIDLKKNFLQYSVSDLNQLKSRYSMLMYKYILSYVRQYKTTDFTVSLQEMREFLNIKKKYPQFKEFDRNILVRVCNEINNSKTLPFLMRIEKQTIGRKVTNIRFVVRPRTTNTETDFFKVENELIYKERYNDLIKAGIPIEEIKNDQADMILERE